jgi:hypothetical protein
LGEGRNEGTKIEELKITKFIIKVIFNNDILIRILAIELLGIVILLLVFSMMKSLLKIIGGVS